MDNTQMITQIEGFIKTEKFSEDLDALYPGLSNVELKRPLTNLINRAAEDFIDVLKNSPSDEKFHDKIKIGLDRIDSFSFSLDTEDSDKICNYFEELMDLVGLDDSGGHLNKWRYGFGF